jgi:hypothetical protein
MMFGRRPIPVKTAEEDLRGGAPDDGRIVGVMAGSSRSAGSAVQTDR